MSGLMPLIYYGSNHLIFMGGGGVLGRARGGWKMLSGLDILFTRDAILSFYLYIIQYIQ